MTDILNKMGEIQSVHLTENEDVKDKSGRVLGKGLRYYADFKKGSIIIQVVTAPHGESFQVNGMYFNGAKYRYDEIFPFHFTNRNWLQYVFLFFAYGLFLFCAITFIKCLQNEMIGGWEKAFWLVAILFGSINLNMFWLPPSQGYFSVGDNTDTALNIKFLILFPSGIVKVGLYNPWRVWISIPIGLMAYNSKNIFRKEPSNK